MDRMIFHWLTYLLHVAYTKVQELLQSQARNGSFPKIDRMRESMQFVQQGIV